MDNKISSKAWQPGSGGKDEGIGNWIVISSPDNLFKHHIDVDFAKLDYRPLLVNIESESED